MQRVASNDVRLDGHTKQKPPLFTQKGQTKQALLTKNPETTSAQSAKTISSNSLPPKQRTAITSSSLDKHKPARSGTCHAEACCQSSWSGFREHRRRSEPVPLMIQEQTTHTRDRHRANSSKTMSAGRPSLVPWYRRHTRGTWPGLPLQSAHTTPHTHIYTHTHTCI